MSDRRFRRHSMDEVAVLAAENDDSSSSSDASKNNSQTSLNCFGSFGSLGLNFKFGFQLRRALSWTPSPSNSDKVFPETPKVSRRRRIKTRKKRKRRHTINTPLEESGIKARRGRRKKPVSFEPSPVNSSSVDYPSRASPVVSHFSSRSADTSDDILTNRYSAWTGHHPAFEANVPPRVP